MMVISIVARSRDLIFVGHIKDDEQKAFSFVARLSIKEKKHPSYNVLKKVDRNDKNFVFLIFF
jgi:hypothetical protein